jgi:hypothetical protein
MNKIQHHPYGALHCNDCNTVTKDYAWVTDGPLQVAVCADCLAKRGELAKA